MNDAERMRLIWRVTRETVARYVAPDATPEEVEALVARMVADVALETGEAIMVDAPERTERRA